MKEKEPWNKGLTKETSASLQNTSDKLKNHKCFVTDWESAKQKEYQTKKRNNTWNTSKPEEDYYKFLCEKYGKDNIIHQYRDKRYPFNCDFYIKSEDKFIELNYHWSHGEHLFDKTNSEDIALLENWKEKAKTSNYYRLAIEVWTVRDPLKIKILQQNNLNFEIIYRNVTISNN